MKRQIWILTLLLSGCGGYDLEGAILRNQAPRPEDVLITPPGVRADELSAEENSTSQSLVRCLDVPDLLCGTRATARTFNGMTYFLLHIVKQMTQEEPRISEPGVNAWGPNYDLRDDRTTHFQLRKGEDGEFEYCLYIAPGKRLQQRPALGCKAETYGDYELLLRGAFRPDLASAEESDRSGTGAFTLFAERIRNRFRKQEDGLRGKLDFAYRFDHESREVNVQVRDVDPDDDEAVPESNYSFSQRDGEGGTFAFAMRSNIWPGEDDPPYADDQNLPELMVIGSRWHEDLSGRSDAHIFGGDLETAMSDVYITQCWNSSTITEFYDLSSVPEPLIGEIERCVFAEPFIPE